MEITSSSELLMRVETVWEREGTREVLTVFPRHFLSASAGDRRPGQTDLMPDLARQLLHS